MNLKRSVFMRSFSIASYTSVLVAGELLVGFSSGSMDLLAAPTTRLSQAPDVKRTQEKIRDVKTLQQELENFQQQFNKTVDDISDEDPPDWYSPRAPQRTTPLTANQLDSLTSEVTVLIDGINPGSGVLIERKGNTYTVLTAAHVVGTPDEYDVITLDQQKYPLKYSTVQTFPGLDLAILRFDSTKVYPVVPIGDSSTLVRGDTVYIGGFPAPSSAIPDPIFIFASGEILGLGAQGDGYGMVYSNPGMVDIVSQKNCQVKLY